MGARYLTAYHGIMTAETRSRSGDVTVSFRKLLRQQAGRMRRAVEGKEEYDPYTPR